jgi:hypothetical protein
LIFWNIDSSTVENKIKHLLYKNTTPFRVSNALQITRFGLKLN